MMEFISYLGMADYIFLFLIIFFILMTFISMGDEEAPVAVILIGVIVLGPMYYINHIPYGTYKAKYVEYNGKKVGEGTKENKSFELDIDGKYIRRDKGSKIPLCTNKFNLYVTIYCTKYTQVTVTAMGTVKYTKKYGKSTIKATVDVKY